MAIVSIVVLLSQNPRLLVVVFVMNFLRESQEMFIDPLNPPADAIMPPIADFFVHMFIVILELIALVTLYKISKQLDEQPRTDLPGNDN